MPEQEKDMNQRAKTFFPKACSQLTVLLGALVCSPGAMATSDGPFGYAHVNRIHAEGWAGVRFDIKAPFFSTEDVLLNVKLRLKVRKGEVPENATCSLMKDFRHDPADLHAAAGEDGGLGLHFDHLDAFTHLRFVVAWKNGPEQKAYAHSAAIRAADKDLFWERSNEKKFGAYHQGDEGTPIQIVITGPEDCRLI